MNQKFNPQNDDFYNNELLQINWWAPIAPLSEGRTMKIYPSYFRKPVPNTSESWDYDELRAHAKAGKSGFVIIPSLFVTINAVSSLL